MIKSLPMAAAARTCLFCDMIEGRKTTHTVFQDSRCFAFLDHRPLFPGHCLLVPRSHYETFMDLPRNRLGPFFSRVQKLSTAVEKGLEADGVFVAMNNRVSQSVPHLHVHIVPRRRKDGLKGFFWPRRPYRDPDQIRETIRRIRAAL